MSIPDTIKPDFKFIDEQIGGGDTKKGKELREFYYALNEKLFDKTTKAKELYGKSNDDYNENYNEKMFNCAAYITKSLAIYIIAPFFNLNAAITALKDQIDSPLSEKQLKRFNLDFAELKGNTPKEVISIVKDMLTLMQPVCKQIIDHYSSDPPRMKEACKKTKELMEQQDYLELLVYYCAGLCVSAGIRPELLEPKQDFE